MTLWQKGKLLLQRREGRKDFGFRWLLAALVMLVVGVYLNATKPLWLAPPGFEYTPLVYAALAFAWLPLLAVGMARLMTHRRAMLVLLLVLIAGGQWFCWASVAPHREILEMTAWMSAMTTRRCAYTGQTQYACETRMASSDSPQVWVLTQKFTAWPGWPLMWLDESHFVIED